MDAANIVEMVKTHDSCHVHPVSIPTVRLVVHITHTQVLCRVKTDYVMKTTKHSPIWWNAW